MAINLQHSYKFASTFPLLYMAPSIDLKDSLMKSHISSSPPLVSHSAGSDLCLRPTNTLIMLMHGLTSESMIDGHFERQTTKIKSIAMSAATPRFWIPMKSFRRVVAVYETAECASLVRKYLEQLRESLGVGLAIYYGEVRNFVIAFYKISREPLELTIGCLFCRQLLAPAQTREELAHFAARLTT